MEHVLKTWPQYYDAVARGDKNFEIRRDDRGFQKGDTLLLVRMRKTLLGGYDVEYDNSIPAKYAHTMRFVIKYVLTGGQLGLEPGYVALALERLPDERKAESAG